MQMDSIVDILEFVLANGFDLLFDERRSQIAFQQLIGKIMIPEPVFIGIPSAHAVLPEPLINMSKSRAWYSQASLSSAGGSLSR